MLVAVRDMVAATEPEQTFTEDLRPPVSVLKIMPSQPIQTDDFVLLDVSPKITGIFQRKGPRRW